HSHATRACARSVARAHGVAAKARRGATDRRGHAATSARLGDRRRRAAGRSARLMDAAEVSAVAMPAGAKLGRYQGMRRIAVGGMAELYLARNVGRAGFEKLVAIKRVRPHLAEDGEFVQMFLDEARLAAGLEHSGIASVFDFGSSGREHFMAMEYVHGKNVRD